MRKRSWVLTRAFAIAIALSLFGGMPSFAQDYVSDAAEALKKSTVYVAPGATASIDNATNRLKDSLHSDDAIVLVMLPGSLITEQGINPQDIAQQLSDKLGNKRIIGLAVGNDLVGFAPNLPNNVAREQMSIADTVTNDPVTALSVFARNIHKWQDANPKPQPPLIPSPKENKTTWVGVVVMLLLTTVIAVGGAIYRGNKSKEAASPDRTRYNVPDEQLRERLADIARMRLEVDDANLQETIYNLCVDIEKYFEQSSKDKRRDSLLFRDRLDEVSQVLDKYLHVQENNRYYYDPRSDMLQGKKSIEDFANYVLDSIRRGNAADLLEYKVNTNILAAQKFR